MNSQRFVRGGVVLVVLGGLLMTWSSGAGRGYHAVFASTEKLGQPPPGTEHYQKYCLVCHGADGRGTQMKPAMPAIPDFTSGSWQESRSNVELLVGILEGRGTQMPAFNDKLTREQGRDLVKLVRDYKKSSATAAP